MKTPIGVLLVNVGSPDAPEAAAVRRYLAEFLGDPAVVRLPRWLWVPEPEVLAYTTQLRERITELEAQLAAKRPSGG